MQHFGSDPEIQAMLTRTRARAQRAAEEHVARMAALPPGTCDNCYGDGCSSCREPVDERYAYGVPYEFQRTTLATIEPREGQAKALEAAGRVIALQQRDLFLHGGVGAGKTQIACALANSAMRAGWTVTFARVPMLLYSLQPGRDPEELAATEARILQPRLLVLDDIGAERDQASDFTRRTLLMFYESRCDGRRRTVFTSNKDLNDLGKQQDDDRLTSRIAGRCDVVHVKTPDQRLRRVK